MPFGSQSFLPYITPDNRILGILPIVTTVFTGNETTFAGNSLIAVSYQQVSMPTWQENKVIQYMAIPVSPSLERQFQKPGQINQYAAYTFWQNSPGFSFLDYRGNSLLTMLQGTQITATYVPPVAVAPTVTAGVTSYALSADFRLTPTCTFFDINWVAMVSAVSGNSDYASITVGKPTTDPSLGNLRAYVIATSPVLATLNSIAMNTVRFVKVVEGPIPAGAYVYPVTITNTSGLTTSTTITVNVI